MKVLEMDCYNWINNDRKLMSMQNMAQVFRDYDHYYNVNISSVIKLFIEIYKHFSGLIYTIYILGKWDKTRSVGFNAKNNELMWESWEK